MALRSIPLTFISAASARPSSSTSEEDDRRFAADRSKMIDGKTKLIAHIGYPTESFKSPMIYNPFFEKRKINAVVVPMGCKAEDYASFLKLVFRLSNIGGALITMPHKVTTLDLVEEASVSAKIAGACNAVKIDERGRVIGDMFDGEGFARGLARKGRKAAGASVLVSGC